MNTEQTWAAIVVEQLKLAGWQVYQEVEIPGGRVDIVAVRGPIRWAIEVKTSMNLAVMEQARRNQMWFHFSSIAVPRPARGQFGPSWKFAAECGTLFGFGVLCIFEQGRRVDAGFTRYSEGRLNRKPGPIKLWEQQRTECAAGSSTGGHWTDFKHTVRQLEHTVRLHPGVKLREAVKSIRHHYSNEPSAVGCISRYIRSGIITSLRLDSGQLYLKEAA
ncbi:hypothetical protein [Hymenobacter sp. 102]|uniref:hypothetical protein n=1 Tax=Hymenobacter sp. 102 TaxID=3403152 RepID=UPI003CE866FD